jgi:plastocyanin
VDIVKTLLDVAATFITPDWGALVQLIPVGLALVVVLYLAWVVRTFATAGPTRRAPARIAPIPPPTVHMPGGSAAPILVALGAFALFAGMIIGGLWLLVGVIVLVLTLLAWGREAVGDYRRIDPLPALPAVVHAGPPPGVHMPGPSILPLMGALGTATLFAGLVIGGWVLVVAIVFLVFTLLAWLVDFTAEYRKVEEADRTGHLENIVPRRLPTFALGAFAVVFVLVALIQAGIFPPRVETSGGPGASGAPASAGAAASLPPNTFAVVAKDVAYDTHAITVPANTAFHIQFDNQDVGVDHDVDIRDASGKTIQDEPHTSGGQTQVYDYTALPPGTYTFICSVHPIASMTGTLTVGP